MQRSSGSRPPLLRWVTWWPVPYWTDRFNRLAERDEIRFEAVFLAAAGTGYEGLVLHPEEWRFAYRILHPQAAAIGFLAPHRRRPDNPLPLVRGDSSLRLVMSYADPTYLAAAPLARARGVGYSLFVANTRFDHRPETPARELLKRLMFRGARCILATGPLQRDYALGYAPHARIVEIGNPVDPARASTELAPARAVVRRELGWSDEQAVLLFVGRLAEEKEIGTLLRAAALLRESGTDVAVVLAGSGPLEAELRDLAEELQVPVHFPGFVQGAALAGLYAAADVFVLPSSTEPWGLVVNEAMHAGLPVVVSDHVGAQPLVEPGVNGDVFPCRDSEALARRLAPFLRDPVLRAHAGEAARSTIESQTIDGWIDRVFEGVGVA